MDAEWNKPDRHDSYLMQIACEIRRVLHKRPDKVKLSHFRLMFGEEPKKRKKKLTRQQASERSMAAWFVGVGVNPDTAKNAFQRTRSQSGQLITKDATTPVLPDPDSVKLKDE
jgi:hypothetical protein